MAILTLFDKSLDAAQSENYHLTLQVDRSGCAYCILDTVWNKYIALKHTEFDGALDKEDFYNEIEKQLSNDEYLTWRYKSVGIIFNSSQHVLIPKSYFQTEYLRALYTLNHPLGEYEELQFSLLKKTGAYNVFAIPSFLVTLLSRQFNKPQYFHQQSPFIEFLLNPLNGNKQDTRCVALNMSHDFFDIVVYDGKKLILSNSFTFNNGKDILYYVLYIYKQLQLNVRYSKLQLYGHISDKSPCYLLLKKHIKHIEFGGAEQRYMFSSNFHNLHLYSFANLFNLYNLVD